MDISLYLDSDSERREKQISDFLSSHKEWQEYKRTLHLYETKGDQLTDDNVKLLVGGITSDNTKDEGDDETLTLENISDLLFRPGMKFRGTICIPSLGRAEDSDSDNNDAHGDMLGVIDGVIDEDEDEVSLQAHDANVSRNTNNIHAFQSALAPSNSTTTLPNDDAIPASNRAGAEQKIYELVILEKGEDEFGNDFILASHSAYDDTQCVYINVQITESLYVTYEDEETCISGCWTASTCSLDGFVRQRLQANDGAFHTCDEVTHVFSLKPSFQEDLRSSKTRAFVELRNQTYKKGLECVEIFNDIFKSDGLRIELDDFQALKSRTALLSTDNERVKSLWKLRESNWKDLLSLCSNNSEKTCARYRWQASFLDSASFETVEKRSAFFEKLNNAGFCLRKAHSEWDHCNVAATRVVQIALALSRATSSSLTGALNENVGVLDGMMIVGVLNGMM